jgi:hypothetical protein
VTEPGKSWRHSDKNRVLRSRRPRRKPTTDMTMPDGSPLRHLGATDRLLAYPVTDDDDLDAAWLHTQMEKAGWPDDRDFDTAAELADAATHVLDGVHGCHIVDPLQQRETDIAHHRLLEYCLLCNAPIPFELRSSGCEFGRSKGCHCNGCIAKPVRGPGRPRYCSARCRDRVDNARARAERRVQGKRSRRFDPDADRVATHAVTMKHAARESKIVPPMPDDGHPNVWRMPARNRPITHGLLLIHNPNMNSWQIKAAEPAPMSPQPTEEQRELISPPTTALR